MSGCVWGGSEELWAATALEALNFGHEVFVSVLGWNDKAPKGYVGLMEHAKRVADRGALYLRNFVIRRRATRFRSILRLAEPDKPY
jgi:hypothetical protein